MPVPAYVQIELQLRRDSLNRELDKLRKDVAAAGQVSFAVPDTGARGLNRLRAGLQGVGAAADPAGQALRGFSASVRRAIDDGLEFDRQLTRLRQTAEEPAGAVRGLGEQIQGLAAGLGVGGVELAKTAVTLKQAGLSIRETGQVLEAVAKASLSPSFEGGQKQIAELAIASRQFGGEISDVGKRIGATQAVAAAFAVEAGDLAKAVQKAGGASVAAGLSFEETLGLFTSVRATTRESADQIATGLRTTFARLQRADVIDQLDRLGVSLRVTREEAERLGDVSKTGQFVGGFEAVKRLSEATAGLPTGDPRYSGLLESLGGFRQLSRVIPLLQQFSVAQKAASVAQLGAGSLDVAAAQAQEAATTRLTKALESLNNAGRDVVQSKTFQRIVDLLVSGAGAAGQLASALGPIAPLLGGIAAVRLAAPSLVGAAGGLAGRVGLSGAAGAAAVGAGVLAPVALPRLTGGGPATDAAGGLLAGAATGAALGATFGPLTAGLGAAVGALVGLTEAVRANTESRSAAKVEAALSQVADSVQRLRAGPDAAAGSALNRQLTTVTAELDSRAAGAGPRNTFDARQFAADRRQSLLRELGGQLVPLGQAAVDQAQRLGAANPDADPRALVRRFARDNQALVATLSRLNGQSEAATLKPLFDSVAAAQRQTATDSTRRGREDDSARAVASFSGLAAAVERSGKGLAALTDAALSVSNDVPGLRPLDPDRPGVLARIARPLGAAGVELADRNAAGRAVARVLPTALAQLSSQDALDGPAFQSQLRDLTAAALGPGGGRGRAAALDAVADAAGRTDPADLVRQARVNPGELAGRLLADFRGPVGDTAGKLSAALSENGQRLADALATGAAKVAEAGEAADRAADLRLVAVRQAAVVRAEARGGGDPGRFLSLDDLSSPFLARQRRLLDGSGLAETDVEGIAGELARVRGLVRQAAADRQAALGTPQFAPTADRFQALASTADRLKQALQALAEPSARLAVIQERVVALSSDRDSRIALAERRLFADPAERARLDRDTRLVRDVAADPDPGRRFARLGLPGQQAVVRGAREVANADVGGGFTGESLRQFLLAGLDPAKEKERADLIRQGKEVADQAVKAQEALAAQLAAQTGDFFAKLGDAQRTFLSDLRAALVGTALADARTRLAAAGGPLGETRQQSRQAEAVRSFGLRFDGDADVQRLQTFRPELAEYSSRRQELTEFQAARRAIDPAAVLAASQPFRKDLSDADAVSRVLVERGLTGEAAADVGTRFDGRLSELMGSRGIKSFRDSPELTQARRDALRDALTASTGAEVGRRSAEIAPLASRIQAGIPGVQLDRVTPAAVAALDQALAAFGRAGSSLSTLDQRLTDAAEAAARAAAAVTELERASRSAAGTPAPMPSPDAPGPVYRQVGGPVPGRPRGTDTVPAWLSPGEYVLNRQAAAANRPLLDRLNKDPKALSPFAAPLGTGTFAQGAARPFGRQTPELPPVPAPDPRPARRPGDRFVRELAERQQRARELAPVVAAARTSFGLADPRPARSAPPAGPRRPGERVGDYLVRRLAERKAAVAQRAADLRPVRDALPLLAERTRLGTAADAGAALATFGYADLPGGRTQADLFARASRLTGDQAVRRFDDDAGRRFAPGLYRDPGFRPGFAAGGEVPPLGAAGFTGPAPVPTGPLAAPVPGRGSADTVPARLMPGEFVLNRQAVQRVGLESLQRANAPGGGGAEGPDRYPELAAALKAFAPPADKLSSSLTMFGAKVDVFAAAVDRFPTEVEHTHTIGPVVVAGGGGPAGGLDAGTVGQLTELMQRAVEAVVGRTFPDAPRVVRGRTT